MCTHISLFPRSLISVDHLSPLCLFNEGVEMPDEGEEERTSAKFPSLISLLQSSPVQSFILVSSLFLLEDGKEMELK